MRNKLMKLLLTLLLLVAIPSAAFSAMDSYCSAPPYVTRTIAPNIMIVMDNSEDMLKPAYTDLKYSPNGTKDNYIGYFKPQSCYEYSSGKFREPDTDGDGVGESSVYTDSCPASAPFRGNLLNWATMSKYDVLQKVIVGGNATSKQGNAHTLVGISGIWPEDPETFPSTARYYNGCEFRMDNGNLTILDHLTSGTGSCPLLDSATAASFAMEESSHDLQSEPDLSDLLMNYVDGATGQAREFLSAAHNFWDSVNLISEAWAAQPCSTKNIVPGALNGKAGEPFYLTLTFPHKKSGTASWTVNSSDEADIATGLEATDTYDGILTDGIATWTVADPDAGTYNFNIDAFSTTCDGPSNYTSSFVIVPNPPVITHYADAVADAVVGFDYSYTLTGQGGKQPLTWSEGGGLPTGLSLSAAGEITGTPTASGSYSFTVTLTDSSSPIAADTSKTLTMTVHKGLSILSNTLADAWEGLPYTYNLEATGGNPESGYLWTLVAGSWPTGVTMTPDGVISGTPAAGSASSYPITVEVKDANGAVTKNLTLTVGTDPGHVTHLTGSVLPSTFNGDSYSAELQADGGCLFNDGGDYHGSYKWWVDDPVNFPLPDWMSLTINSGETATLSGTPDNIVDTPYTFIIGVEGCGGHQELRTFKLISLAEEPTTSSLNSETFAVKVVLEEDPLTLDQNGNDSWDEGDTYTDLNGNGQWDGKSGVFHKFWDATNPKARWGMTKFKESGGSTIVNVDSCIPVSNSASFFTSIQNATAVTSSPLADGLYGAINYYGFDAPYGSDSGNNFTGCTNSDPIDNIPCRKNFILMISSGANVSGNAFASGTTSCDELASPVPPLVQNACYGYQQDLRTASDDGKQNVYTYVVNTMGENTTNNDILKLAAAAGGGADGSQYYEAQNGDDIEDQLTKAIEDILAQAASGTAVSVLTTSSRGIGSMMQAYFLPIRQEAEREVRWTGYVQNLWIDPDDNLREDSDSDYRLRLDEDDILRLYFNEQTNEAKAALFTDPQLEGCADGTGSPASPAIKSFNEVSYTWEGGSKLATRPPSERNLFTAKKVIHGDPANAGEYSFELTNSDFKQSNSLLDAALDVASDADAADDVIGYVRGECLETGVSGDSACGATVDPTYRDRRIDGKVWKLGDVISSTPKVLAGTPNNTYHIDYGDLTYYNFVSSKGSDFADNYGYGSAEYSYSDRSSMAFVGANDGIMHAFRVGYLKDKGLEGVDSDALGLFKDDVNALDSENLKIGEEVWGYVPYNALPYLKYLADPNYCHIYYNDLSVRLIDASLGSLTADDSADAKAEESWKTILVGGMRFGGACDGGVPSPPGTVSNVGYSAYYAIDVTDAEHPVPLWEFSDPDLGYTTGFPSVLRTGDPATNGRWYIAFGSGSNQLPKHATDIARSTTGYLYILDLETGEIVQKEPLATGEIVGDVLTIDKNKDYVTERLYFGTANKSTGVWNGRLLGLDIPNQDLSSGWAPEEDVIFTGAFPFTASPDAASDVAGNTWVYAGSGKYYSDVDEGVLDDNIFVGIKDALGGVTYPVDITTTGVDDKTAEETTGTVTETETICGYDSSDNKFKQQTVVTKTDNTSGVQTTPDIGWYVTLPNGERVISRPLAVGGLVDYLTYIPSSDECSYGGESYLYAVGYTTGEAPNKIAIRNTQTTGGATSGDVTISRGIRLGPGAPPTGEAIIIPPPKEGQEQLKKKIQVATGVIVEAENTPAISVTSEIVHWLKK